MRIQESLVTDKQIALELYSENGRYRLPIEGKDYYFPTVEKVHEAFLNQNTYDTIKLTHGGKKSYLHLFMDEIEVFDTKKALRQRLSQDSQGMWAEIRNGKKHYYVEERGWMSTSYKEITEKECLEKIQQTSTMIKVLGIGLGMLALLPGAFEFARHLPISTKEAAMGLIALNQKSPVLGAIGYLLLPTKADAQAVGTEFQVNTFTTSDQIEPSVAPLNDGGFVVIWRSIGQDGNGSGSYGQKYDSIGVTVGSEFQVNTYITSDQNFPSVAPLNDGGFIVTWASYGQDSYGYGLYGQRYDNSGVTVGSEFQVNTYTTNDQKYPSVAPLNDGGFIVTWASYGQDGDSDGVYGQRYDSNGSPIGTEFQINTYTTSDQNYPRVAPLNDGGFVVTWQSNGQDGDFEGIFGRRYDANGTIADTEFQVNTYTASNQRYPSVASLSTGAFVMTWQSNGQDGDGDGIFGQRYDSSGVPNSTEFQVNTYTTGDQIQPSIARLNDGGFVVAWASNGQDGDNWGIFGQRYDSNGAATGPEFQINAYTSSYQIDPSIAPLNDGGFIVTWVSDGQDGDGKGIYGQRYDMSGNAIRLQFGTTLIVTPSPSTTRGPPNSSTSMPSFVTTRSALTRSTIPPSNPPSPTPAPTSSTLGSTTVSSTGPTSNPLATVSTQSTSTSSTSASGNTPSLSAAMSRTSPTTSMITSAAPSSNTQAAVSTSSSRLVTSASPGTTPISSTPVIGSVENIVYGESYPLLINDEVVGTYTVSGGNGSLDSGNLSIISFEFDPGFQPEEGDVITLFYLPEEEVALWESIEIEGESFECLTTYGQIVTNDGLSSFQVFFEDTECLAMAPTMLASALPLTLN